MGRILLLHPHSEGPSQGSEATSAPNPKKGNSPWLTSIASLFAIVPCAAFMAREFHASFASGLGVVFNGSNLRPEGYFEQNVLLLRTIMARVIERFTTDDVDHWMMWTWGIGAVVGALILVPLLRFGNRKLTSSQSWRRNSYRMSTSPVATALAVVFGVTAMVSLLPIVLAAIAGYGFLMPGMIAEKSGRLYAKEIRERVQAADAASRYPTAVFDGPNSVANGSLIIDCAGECLLYNQARQQFLVVRSEQILRQEAAKGISTGPLRVVPHGPPM